MNWLKPIFDDSSLMPHGYCLVWNPGLIWLQSVSDGVIGLAFYSIPLVLLYFAARRPDVGFGWVFSLFAAFILLCGTTHFVEIWTLWHPAYVFQGMLKAVTAVVSLATAILLLPALPKALVVPSPAQLRLTNDNLSREVEERSEAVEALAREKEFTELLINSMSECVATMDPNLVVRLWNRAMTDMTRQPPHMVIGRSIFDVNPLLRGSVFEEGMRAALAGGEFILENQQVDEGLPSAGRWVDARYSPIRDRAGEVIGCIVFLRDVTQRHQMDEALRQAQKMEAIGQLTGGIAHDFNNFLTAIIGNLDLIGSRFPDAPPAIERLRDSALQGALRAARLTRQLLAFSRRQMLSPCILDVNALVESMSDLIRRTLGERIVTETELASGLWRTFADPNQLESALLNLAINARDAMPGGGRLMIETANAYLDDAYAHGNDAVQPGQYVVVSVIDTGGGMTLDVKERAFDPFFTTKRVGEGSGLGLSQVYGFVKQSGGHVKIYSEVGRGTTVKLYLPRRSETAEKSDDQALSTRSPRTPTGERVLVVEDEPIVRDFTCEALQDLGYEVVATSDAVEAIPHIEGASAFDLIVTDLGLPGLDGRQVAELARQRWPGIKVLYVTGYGRNAMIDGGALEPGADLLTKPFDSQTLALKVRNVLER